MRLHKQGGGKSYACHPLQLNSSEPESPLLLFLLLSVSVLVSSSLCVFKRRSLTFILVFLSQAMGGYGREGRQRGVCMCGDAGLWNEVSSRGGFTHSWETRQRTAPVCLTYIQTHRGLTQKERRGEEGEGRKCWDGHVWTCLSAS